MYLKACALILFFSVALCQEAFLAQSIDNAKVIAEKDRSKPLKPASVAKLFVIGALADKAEEQFVTKIYETNDSIVLSFDLDPLFTTERLFKVIERVAALGRDKPFLDLEFPKVEGGRGRVGIRAYESGVSGVMFNFNSVEIVGCEEPNILPLFSGFSVKKQKGTEFSAECGDDSCIVSGYGECESKFRSVQDPKVYLRRSVEGLVKLLLSPNIVVREARADAKTLIAEVPGSRVRESLDALGRYSTNSIAEMLLYLLGDRTSYELGLRRLNEYAQGFSKYPVLLKDGSGLSHDSRVPVDSVVRLLVEQERELPKYLSIGGVSGTLKSRNLSKEVVAKTGSLDGVSALAGYVFKGKQRVAFAIFQQGDASKEREDKFVRSLLK